MFVDIVNGLHERGYDVVVLTFDYPGRAFYNLNSEIRRLDIAINHAGQPLPRVRMLQALPKIRSSVTAEMPDVIVAFMHSTYVPVSLATLGLSIPFVASEHTTARHYDDRPLQRWVRELVDRRASLRTVPSEAARLSYQVPPSAKCIVVSNPVKLEGSEGLLDRDPMDPPELLSIGRLMEEKDHMVLLSAFSRVATEFKNWRLRIVGDGPLRSQLQDRVDRLGLGARVEISGYVKDVTAAYARAKFVVVHSRYESFGMVAAEALIAGRAVLYFDDCLGVAEIVEGGKCGLAVSGSSDTEARISALASGLVRLMGDPDLCDRLGSKGPLAMERYGLEAVLDRWEDIISQAKCRAVSKT